MGAKRKHQDRVSPLIVQASRSFGDWCRRKLLSDNYEPNKPLYHYTGPEGVEGIVARSSFRLSGLSHLRKGDRKEIEYGVATISGVLTSETTNDDPVRSTLAQAALHLFSWERFTTEFDCYVGCFTAHAEVPKSGVGLVVRTKASHLEFVQSTSVHTRPCLGLSTSYCNP